MPPLPDVLCRVLVARAQHSRDAARNPSGSKEGGGGRDAAAASARRRALLLRIGSAEPIEIAPLLLIGGRRSLQGWPLGTSSDSEDTLAFSALADIRPMTETMPLERAADAYERMTSGAARFRMVITTGE